MYKIYTCALKYNKLTSTFSCRSVLYRNDLILMLSREFLDQKYCWLGWLTVPSVGKFGHPLKWLIISQMMVFCVTILQILLGDWPKSFKTTYNGRKYCAMMWWRENVHCVRLDILPDTKNKLVFNLYYDWIKPYLNFLYYF